MSDITASAIENLAQSDDDTKKAIDETHENKENNSTGSAL